MAEFDKHQKKYYTTTINRAIPTNARVDQPTLDLALGDVDPEMPGSNGNRRAKETASFIGSFGTTNNLAGRDAQCGSYTSPSLAMRGADQRAGCGWWFVPDLRTQSVGAYGTRRGPMNTQLDTQVGNGEWIWNLDEAARRESTKVASKVKACPDIEYYKKQNPNLGWCPSMGTGVVVDRYGRPAFPRYPGGYCPDGEKIIMNSSECPPPEPPSLTDPGQGGGAGISWLCSQSTGGSLSPQCLKAITGIYCSSNGTLSQALSSGYAASSSDFNNANKYLNDRGFSLDQGLVNGGQTTIWTALQSVAGLRNVASSGDYSTSTRAAANLCYGSPFTPCNDIRDDKTQPYDAWCIVNLAIGMGYSWGADFLQRKDMSFYNGMATWKVLRDTLAYWKQVADTGSEPSKQVEAIRNVYGISVNFPIQACDRKVMYGPWIGFDAPVNVVKALTTGEAVYMIEHQQYTKMVSESGVAKYYVGVIGQFDPNSWNSYASAANYYILRPATKPRLYTDYNYAGGGAGPGGVEFDVGSYPFSSFTAKIPNDSVSSVYVPPGYRVTIYQGDLSGQWGWPNFPRTTLTSSVPDLRSFPGYDKTMSAVVVEKA